MNPYMYTNFVFLSHRDTQMFQKSRSRLKILGAKWVT